MKNRTVRGILILVVLLVAAYYLAPLLVKNGLPSFWTKKQLKLGLDLQGGMQITLEVDTSELPAAEKDAAVKTAKEIITNRVDQFGVAEPSIQQIGTNRIIVQLPGMKDFSRAKGIIGKTALLEFKLLADGEQTQDAFTKLDKFLQDHIEEYAHLKAYVDDSETEVDLLEEDENAESDSVVVEEYNDVFTTIASSKGYPMVVDKKNVPIIKELLADPKIQKTIPSGLTFSLAKENSDDPHAPRVLYLLIDKAEVTGKNLEDAKVTIGQGYDPQTSGKPIVKLNFNKKGAKAFERVTGQNINKRLAIVLDDVVYMAPNIKDKIRSGEAIITGGFTMDEAQDIVIVLKAGNLPAPVNIIEERTVGPTLGKDSIDAGTKAAYIGLILVVIFMIIYYKLAGLIANIAVAVNIGFILSVLTMLEGTLTMPGIAGMILTIGMAVDANVLIFERIREELKVGKTPRTAVDAGFNRAMVTILDANITTLITAIVLYQFGTGPIRGFAVTLSIGIIGSMFASIILVKAIFDGFIVNKNRNKISI